MLRGSNAFEGGDAAKYTQQACISGPTMAPGSPGSLPRRIRFTVLGSSCCQAVQHEPRSRPSIVAPRRHATSDARLTGKNEAAHLLDAADVPRWARAGRVGVRTPAVSNPRRGTPPSLDAACRWDAARLSCRTFERLLAMGIGNVTLGTGSRRGSSATGAGAVVGSGRPSCPLYQPGILGTSGPGGRWVDGPRRLHVTPHPAAVAPPFAP